MPQPNEPKFIKPAFPQITETYGASAQGDSYALLTRKTIYQPSGNAFLINRKTQEEARCDVIFPGIDPEESQIADGFTVSLVESVTEEYEKEEGKLLEKQVRKQEPIGKIAPDDFPENTARIASEWTTETWEYSNGIPIRHETVTRKPTIAVAGSYADFETGEGLGLIPAEKQVETWVLQSSSATQNKYLHTVQNFKTRGELFPEYVAEWDNWTVGLGLCLDPSSPEPEIVEIAPEPITNDPGQPIERTSDKKERDTYYPEDDPEYEPDQPLEPTQDDDPYEEPTPDEDIPDPETDYEPDSPPWEPEIYDNWDNPDEIYLDDTPEDADLETVAETAAALSRARQFPYEITHPIRKVDITSYRPLARVHIDGKAFIRDGFSIALGEGAGGGKELAIAYTGLLIGKLNNSGIAIPTYKSVVNFGDSVLVSGTATLVDPARAVAESLSRTLIFGTIESETDPNYNILCTTEGVSGARAVEWMGDPGGFDASVEIAPNAGLLGQTWIYAIGWTEEPNLLWAGANQLASFNANTSFYWDNSTYKWLSFIVKIPHAGGHWWRGLYFHAGATSFYIYGR